MQTINVALVGNVGVGKTTLLRQLFFKDHEDVFYPDNFAAGGLSKMIGNAKYHFSFCEIDSTMHMDTRYACYNRADVLLVVFSLQDPSSFQSIQTFVQEIRAVVNMRPILLVGTHRDRRRISLKDARKMAHRLHCNNYWENEAVDTLVEYVVKEHQTPTRCCHPWWSRLRGILVR